GVAEDGPEGRLQRFGRPNGPPGHGNAGKPGAPTTDRERPSSICYNLAILCCGPAGADLEAGPAAAALPEGMLPWPTSVSAPTPSPSPQAPNSSPSRASRTPASKRTAVR